MSCLFRRGMASNRNHTVEGVSNETNITEEVRDLIKNMRHAENMDEWKRGVHIEEPIDVKTFRPNRDADIDDDQEVDIKYYPHAGEMNEGAWKQKQDPNWQPPLVLIVQLAEKAVGEPYWHKEVLEKLGLGAGAYFGKKVAVPNMTHYTSLVSSTSSGFLSQSLQPLLSAV